MTIHDEILICANQLANAGKKPTVALVKGKMSQRAPLAKLITTLKNWQHQPDFISPIKTEEEHVNQKAATNDTSALVEAFLKDGSVKKIIQQSIDKELSEMKREISDMKLLIKDLTGQLDKKQ